MSEHNSEMNRILCIARSIAGETGHRLLARLVEALGQHLEASFVAITYAEGEPPNRARIVFAVEEDASIETFRYDLNETPCARVYRGETVTIPCDLASLYPKEAEYEGYIGIPLRDTAGTVLGHLLVLSKDVIRDPELATAIVQIFSVRAEAELNRLVEERTRQKLISDLAALNTRLQGGYARLRRESIQKTGLMGLIAHDLRSPLSAILSQAELGRARLAAANNDPDKLDTGFRKIIDNADRMVGLIKATLERARHDSAAIQTAPSLAACRASSGSQSRPTFPRPRARASRWTSPPCPTSLPRSMTP